MQAAQSAKTALAHTDALEVGQNNSMSIADDDILNVAVAVDQHADLPVDFMGDFRKLAGKLLRDNLARRDAPLVELFQAV
ncbi:MAG TPA: hypothetical protein VNO70_05665 [Blastocatellia bacterium]|nr:hypothetical protein [Blastocatellia bacterium]